MSEANGTPAPQPSVRQQLRETRAKIALRRAQHELQVLEAWGDPFAGWYPNPFDGLGPIGVNGRAWLPVQQVGRASDRRDGGDRPALQTEVDLDRQRGLARWLAEHNPVAIGVLDTLETYTVRTGYQYEAQPGRGLAGDVVARELAPQVQRVIEEFTSLNVLGEEEVESLAWADREAEAVRRSARDGEVGIRTFDQGDGTTLARFVEPEQVRQPLGSPSNWSWGMQNAPGDVERIVSYAVSYSADPDDWEEVPAREMSWLKANTDSTVKRGLSDFFSISGTFDETVKLLRNLRIGATAQAAIAWIEQHAGATQEALNALVSKTRNLNPPTHTDPLTGRDVSQQRMEPGQRLLVGAGRQYQSAPLAQNTTQHLAIFSACLRSLGGGRWKMPEYMISGDASNANYASTLVSGSPFVTRTECQQARFGRFFLRVIWQAIRNAARHGRFRVGGRVLDYAEVSRLIDVVFTPPQVAISDKTAEAAIDHQDLLDGVTSRQIIAAKRGYDFDKVTQDLAKAPLPPPPGTPAPGLTESVPTPTTITREIERDPQTGLITRMIERS